jgi:hypothetical protein
MKTTLIIFMLVLLCSCASTPSDDKPVNDTEFNFIEGMNRQR